MRRSLIPISLVLALACDSKPADGGAAGDPAAGKEPTPSGESSGAKPPDPAPSKDATAEQTKKKPARESAPKPKVDEAAKLRKQLLALLNEGRALTKKEDYAGGIAKYREALEIDASDVAVLGELGWAAFKAGDLELAHRSTVQALKFVRTDKQRGMLLYNLGRIEEDRSNVADALAHYEASLAARPNDTVQKRLEQLQATANQMAVAGSAGGELEGPDAVAARGPDSGGLEALGRDLADLAAACKVIVEQRCEDFTVTVDETCTCNPTLLATPGVDESWGLVKLGEEGQNMQVAWFPVVKTDKGWTVFSEVVYSYNPGAFGIYEEAIIKPSTVEPLLATGTQLVIRFDKSRFDRDMGLNEVESEDYSGTVICARHETGAYCTKALVSSYNYVREVEFEDEDADIVGEEIEHDLTPPTGFTATFEFADAKLKVTWTDVKNGYDRQGEFWGGIGWVLPAGEHALAKLLGLP